MHSLNTRCSRRFAQGGHLSHTQRFREDLGYQADMVVQGVPEWLVLHGTGHTFRLDGKPGDQWPLLERWCRRQLHLAISWSLLQWG